MGGGHGELSDRTHVVVQGEKKGKTRRHGRPVHASGFPLPPRIRHQQSMLIGVVHGGKQGVLSKSALSVSQTPAAPSPFGKSYTSTYCRACYMWSETRDNSILRQGFASLIYSGGKKNAGRPGHFGRIKASSGLNMLTLV